MEKVQEIESTDVDHQAYQYDRKLKSIAQSLRVPTNDDVVRQRLRELNQTVEIRNESKQDRRERLIDYLAQSTLRNDLSKVETNEQIDKEIAMESIENASLELIAAREKIIKSKNTSQTEYQTSMDQTISPSAELFASQTGFNRGISALNFFSPNLILAGDYGGQLSVLDLDDDMAIRFTDTQRHKGRIGDIASHERRNIIVTGDLSGQLYVHSVKDMVLDFKTGWQGHLNRVTSIDIHHTGDFAISTSHDCTWRLWDLSAPEKALLIQDGHAGGINCGRINSEGCLVATGGLDKAARIWDLRNGMQVTTLKNHPRELYALAWNPSASKGYELVTAGGDNRCLVWDLRHPEKPTDIIYAHTDAITGLSYDGLNLATTSFDHTVKIWTKKESVKLSKVHDCGSRVMNITLLRDQQFVVGRWDRQIDLYRRPVSVIL